MTTFEISQVLGFLISGSIGIFRILKNHLMDHELVIYKLTSGTCFYMAVSLAIFYRGTFRTEEFRYALIRMGWPFVIICLISLQLYYRKFDLKN